MNRQALLDRIAKCRQILEANPESQIFAALADAYRKLGDLKTALDVCNDGLERHPKYGSAHLVLAKIARDQKRFDQAEDAARRAVELEGHTRSAELLLSEIFLQTGKFTEAEEILERLSVADPGNESVRTLRALARKAIKAAAVRAPEAVPSPPEPPPPADQAEYTEVSTRRDGEPWRDLFAALDRYPHLLGKLAVGYDGLLLHTDIEVRSEADATAAMAAELWSAVGGDWPENNFGALEQLLVESGESTWWLWPFAEFLLVLWCEPALNMGPLRLRIHQFEQAPVAQSSGGRS